VTYPKVLLSVPAAPNENNVCQASVTFPIELNVSYGTAWGRLSPTFRENYFCPRSAFSIQSRVRNLKYSSIRLMHFSAKRGLGITCLSVCLSVTLVDCDYLGLGLHGWNSSKIISPSVSLGCSLFAFQTLGSTPRGTSRNLESARLYIVETLTILSPKLWYSTSALLHFYWLQTLFNRHCVKFCFAPICLELWSLDCLLLNLYM